MFDLFQGLKSNYMLLKLFFLVFVCLGQCKCTISMSEKLKTFQEIDKKNIRTKKMQINLSVRNWHNIWTKYFTNTSNNGAI